MHVGHKFANKEEICDFTKYLDLYLAVPSTLMDQGELRKQLYGKAGAYRPKPYGMEYRVLSNYWVFDPKRTEWVWDSVDRALTAFYNKSVDMDADGPLILTAINENNKDMAHALVQKYNLVLA